MFSDNHNIDNLQQLYTDIKRYILLQKEYTKLEIVENMAILISTLTMIFILIILGMIALFYLMFALAYLLESYVGGLANSFGIITGIVALLMLIAYLLRKKLLINPMVNFLGHLFLNDNSEEKPWIQQNLTLQSH